jgi:hypothetical protein
VLTRVHRGRKRLALSLDRNGAVPARREVRDEP